MASKKQKTITVTYQDGHVDTLAFSPAARSKGEEHAQLAGWGGPADSPQRYLFYTAYAAARMSGKTDQPYEGWLATTVDIDMDEPGDPAENPTTAY